MRRFQEASELSCCSLFARDALLQLWLVSVMSRCSGGGSRFCFSVNEFKGAFYSNYPQKSRPGLVRPPLFQKFLANGKTDESR